MKFRRRLGLCVAALSSLLAASASAQSLPPPSGVLALSASASVEVARDVLELAFSATRTGKDAANVQNELKQALDIALVEAKKAARPGQVDVRTGNFSLFPQYSNPGPSSNASPSIVGWQGTAELVVEGRDMAAIAALSGRLTTMTVSRVNYRLSREANQAVEGDVAAQAIAAFRLKAQVYARQFGYANAAIREVNVQTSEPPGSPMPMMRMQARPASAMALPVEAGNAAVTATVSGTVQMQ